MDWYSCMAHMAVLPICGSTFRGLLATALHLHLQSAIQLGHMAQVDSVRHHQSTAYRSTGSSLLDSWPESVRLRLFTGTTVAQLCSTETIRQRTLLLRKVKPVWSGGALTVMVREKVEEKTKVYEGNRHGRSLSDFRHFLKIVCF